jgi:uncharacterized protein DUF6788
MAEVGDPGHQDQIVSPAPDQRAEARRIAAELARALARTDFVLPGSVIKRMTRCGHPNCHCHADPPLMHGPYHQWTRKVAGKTVTRLLTDAQLADYRPWLHSQRPQDPPGMERAGLFSTWTTGSTAGKPRSARCSVERRDPRGQLG